MVDTREVGVGFLPKAIVVNKIEFPQLLGGGYIVGEFIINDTLGQGKAITAINNNSDGLHLDVDVASIDAWLPTHRFFLARTNQPTFTHSTIAAAITAMVAGDEVVVYPEDATTNSMHYTQNATQALPKSGTIRGYSPVDKAIITGDHASNKGEVFQIQTGNTFVEDFVLLGGGNQAEFSSIESTTFLTTSRVRRCLLTGGAFGATGKRLHLINCILMGASLDCARPTFDTGIFQFCMFLFGRENGLRDLTTGVVTATNCLAYGNAVGYLGTIGGSNNASSDATAPGANSIQNVTRAQAAFARHIVGAVAPNGAFPLDWRMLDGEGSPLENAGIAISGITDDYNGRTRADPPNIGPVEGLTNYGLVEPLPDTPTLAHKSTP